MAFSSDEGRAIFREALLSGGMEGYFPLAEQLHTQAEPAFCGLGTLVVLLNALAIDPGRLWRGPWRWFGEDLLDCCKPLDAVAREGITLDQFACLARCNGANVKRYPADESTLAELRHYVRAACAAPGGMHVAVAYSRAALGQSGDGHYSPVGGYHRDRDLVLLLDVARFKYPPHWVSLSSLWDAMQPEDALTRKPRGYFVLRRGESSVPPLCRLPPEGAAFREAWSGLRGSLEAAARESGPVPLEAVVEAFLRRLSPEVAPLLAPPSSGLTDNPEERRRDLEELLLDVRRTDLFSVVQNVLKGRSWQGQSAVRRLLQESESAAELATLLLLSFPPDLSSRLPQAVAASFESIRSPAGLSERLRSEVARLRSQITTLEEYCCGQL